MNTPLTPPDVDAPSLVSSLDWADLNRQLDEDGAAVTPPLLSPEHCAQLSALYDRPQTAFRSTVVMARHGFGRGAYKYFAQPLPKVVGDLRAAFYPPLAAVANRWAGLLGQTADWPGSLQALQERCAAAGQTRPTPLLLRYGQGDYNCLHQDLYGEIHFPLQMVFLLSRPGQDFTGGELVLVEQRPRMQSRPLVVSLSQGAAAIFPVRDRPRAGARGWLRSQMRHGVSVIRAGTRTTLGLIFHDAA